ncbi:flagellar hook-basal body complex protein FliE [Mariprofundus sp. EBB-1]|uniref:flagellar hook-basal body complex protein FliE n=1 Tax=Mariprofundus sp. EBB-1 TaxID=2650971 RepID=UPI000EF19C98|nr:flagellar hook-basal body complex protein FliE [Mariprofundus sp. EBB-1]RLL53027.1 flagellar hook-basal body complex protein FliE [Mariprofundus sp. EBB-1]
MNIHGYQSSPGPSSITTPGNNFQDVGKTASSGEKNFATLLQAYTQQVNNDVKTAAKGAEGLATGEVHNTSETLLAIKKADLSFQLMLGVRNKLVDAYREIIRMQV